MSTALSLRSPGDRFTMAEKTDPSDYRAQAARCRRLAASILDRVTQERLLEAARIYDDLAAKEQKRGRGGAEDSTDDAPPSR